MPQGRRAAVQELTSISKTTLKRLRCCAREVRLELLVLLMAGPETVSGLAALVELDVPMVSTHLSALRAAGLVVSETKRNLRIQSLSSAVTVRMIQGCVAMRIDVPEGFPVTIEIPRGLVDRVHPGWIVEDAPPIGEQRPVVVIVERNPSSTAAARAATAPDSPTPSHDHPNQADTARPRNTAAWSHDDVGPAI